MMRKQVLTLILLWLAIAAAAADDASTVMFDRKYFIDLGNMVNVEGSPTGEGASPDTTRWVLWCYQRAPRVFGNPNHYLRNVGLYFDTAPTHLHGQGVGRRPHRRPARPRMRQS